ncbi:OLC1v1022678C1 [Oldenlandia corymbosa var. corymbosa]|uniref:OLC1v1022678C1 n=1 Tax=Oldenlandia corymbosa var. corymbosa TaxID=529605 RepID=A0AAV1BYM0_OLDCO|nr:OLC1v1022678C1 [Oldenlandia corymbosa var. corymbosa]
MKVIRLVLMLAIAMAISIVLITVPKGTQAAQKQPLLENNISTEFVEESENVFTSIPTKRISRFLAAHDQKDPPKIPKEHTSGYHNGMKRPPKEHTSGYHNGMKRPPKEHSSGHHDGKKQPKEHTSGHHEKKTKPPKEHGRSDHCKKDHDICGLVLPDAENATCCNNKCVDIHYSSNNCGACKNKCLQPFESCCRGKCVNLSMDKRHCGACNHRCMPGGFCFYGECDYA